MKCAKVKRLLSIYLDKELTNKKTVSLIEEHLGRCTACREELDSLIRVKEFVAQKQKLTVGDEFLAGVKNKLQIESTATNTTWVIEAGSLARRLLPVPAGIALLITAILFAKTGHTSYVDAYMFGDLISGSSMTAEYYDTSNWLDENIIYGGD